jgi:hypothetical protein
MCHKPAVQLPPGNSYFPRHIADPPAKRQQLASGNEMVSLAECPRAF